MTKDMEKEGVPSDVVELIIAVDLDPSDPAEPINVNDVQVRGKGGAEGGAFPDYRGLLVRVLEAIGVPAQGMSDNELAKAAEQTISGGEEAADIEEDMFSRAMGKTFDRSVRQGR